MRNKAGFYFVSIFFWKIFEFFLRFSTFASVRGSVRTENCATGKFMRAKALKNTFPNSADFKWTWIFWANSHKILTKLTRIHRNLSEFQPNPSKFPFKIQKSYFFWQMYNFIKMLTEFAKNVMEFWPRQSPEPNNFFDLNWKIIRKTMAARNSGLKDAIHVSEDASKISQNFLSQLKPASRTICPVRPAGELSSSNNKKNFSTAPSRKKRW